MEMNFTPLSDNPEKSHILIAGPCSAESEDQLMQTAEELAKQNIDFFRAGIWKPRTRPNSFEGVGVEGLKWLKKVKEKTGLKVTTEVANKQHVYEALKYGIDAVWLGARTTVNPFSVQEIADALHGSGIPVLIKNPMNPDIQLWIGAIERVYKAGITQIAAIHRGFSYHGESKYRNIPRWQIPIELKRRYPNLPIICDNSHISGNREMLSAVAQKALDLLFNGLMTEVHPCPDEAWSDAKQQVTPEHFQQIIQDLVFRSPTTDNEEFLENLEHLRHQIDEVDDDLLNLLGQRMKLSQSIGHYKKKNNISILQAKRWNEILEVAFAKGKLHELSEGFIVSVLTAIHQESINHQANVMNAKETVNDAG